MQTMLQGQVVPIKDDDTRLNFNLATSGHGEVWCLGPLKHGDVEANPFAIDQEVRLNGHWVSDASGSRVFFFAEHMHALA